MMQLNEKRRAAKNAIDMLRRELIEVVGFELATPRPMIYIEKPEISKLRAKSITEITESIGGIRRQVCIARVGACLVRWNNPIA